MSISSSLVVSREENKTENYEDDSYLKSNVIMDRTFIIGRISDFWENSWAMYMGFYIDEALIYNNIERQFRIIRNHDVLLHMTNFTGLRRMKTDDCGCRGKVGNYLNLKK